MGRGGLEQPASPAGNTPVSDSRGNKSGNIGADSGRSAGPDTPPADPELAAVVAAWPDLPGAVRAGILAMVAASGGGGAR